MCLTLFLASKVPVTSLPKTVIEYSEEMFFLLFSKTKIFMFGLLACTILYYTLCNFFPHLPLTCARGWRRGGSGRSSPVVEFNDTWSMSSLG